jgi:hypothetical protein
MAICYGVLAKAGCWEAAEKVKGQFDGRPVRRAGFCAYEELMKDTACLPQMP